MENKGFVRRFVTVSVKKNGRKDNRFGLVKHGVESKVVRQRYTDKRTKEGRQLRRTMDALTEDLGGPRNITAAQRVILASFESKLIVMLQINKYVDKQKSVIDKDGYLLPVLSRNYITYSESARRDLEALFAIKRKPASQSYEKVLKSLEVE